MQATIPLRVEDSIFKYSYQTKIVLDAGNFYVFDQFIIGEVHEGEHIGWETVKVLIDKVYEHFGTRDIDVAYISNRIHSYSIQPKDWLNFYRERHKISSLSIVAYNKLGAMNIALERVFSKAPFKKFNSLETAIDWVKTGHVNPVQQLSNDSEVL